MNTNTSVKFSNMIYILTIHKIVNTCYLKNFKLLLNI